MQSGGGGQRGKLSPDLIQRRFLRSLETGLISDAVKFQLRPYLCDHRVTDEVLIERVNEAAHLEQERQQKLRKGVQPRPSRISEIQIDLPSDYQQSASSGEAERHHIAVSTVDKGEVSSKNKKCQARCKDEDTESSKQINDLKAEILEMKKMFLETVGASKQQSLPHAPMNAPRYRPPACRACQESGRGESCSHCFRCGQEGHLSRGCRQRRDQGNERGLPGQDRQ